MIYDSLEGTGEFSTKANYKVVRDEELCNSLHRENGLCLSRERITNTWLLYSIHNITFSFLKIQ